MAAKKTTTQKKHSVFSRNGESGFNTLQGEKSIHCRRCGERSHIVKYSLEDEKNSSNDNSSSAGKSDLREKTLSKGEFRSVAAVNGGLEGMINKECKDRDALALVTYIAEEDKLDKILENPQILKIPIVRNGRQATLGYQPDVWKTWE